MAGNPFTSGTAGQSPALTILAPDVATQQMQLARRQQLADMLRKNGMEQQPTEMVSGWAVRQNPLSKLAQAVGGGILQKKNDEQQAVLNQQMSAALSGQLNGIFGTSTPAQPTAQSANERPIQPSVSASPGVPTPNTASPNSQPTNQPSATQIDPYADVRNKAKAAYLMGDTALANKFLEATMPTEMQRNNMYLGINANQARDLELAQRTKQGTQSFQPGQLNILPGGEKIVAPDFQNGIQGGFDANGNPTMGRIAGSSSIAQLAGEKKRAEAAGNAAYDMTPIDTPNGSILVTKEQASNASRGSGGIQVQSDVSKAFGKEVASGAGQDLLKSRDTAKTASEQLFNINESRKAIQSGAFLGSGANVKTDVAKFIKSWVGIDVDPNKVTNSEYLKSTLGEAMLASIKKLGTNPTDADRGVMDEIVGTIAKDPKALPMVLDYQEKMIKRSIENHNKTVSDAESRGLSSPYDLRVPTPSFNSPTTNQALPPNVQSVLDKYR